MKQYAKQNGIAISSLLLALPAAYFICIAILKDELCIDKPFDAIAPGLERTLNVCLPLNNLLI
ncbi:MAG: hypothetical protein ACXWC7_19735, partial [Chitinophagaceae bacterium]